LHLTSGQDTAIVEASSPPYNMPIELGPLAVDRRSPVPLYLQLEDILGREILAGRLLPGDQLPAEPALAHHFGVSRSVIRQALTRLDQEGLVRRAHGTGTFVLRNRQRSWLVQDVAGFFRDEVLRHGHDVTSQILKLEVERMPLWATDALGVPESTPGVVLERLRSVDGILTVYDLNYLPDELAKAVAPLANDPHGSLYEELQRAGFALAGGRRIIDSVIAGPRFAELLNVGAWEPLLVIEGVDWDRRLRAFDCYRTWIRPDRMKIEIQVMPTDAGGSRAEDMALASAPNEGG
jgi:GntR family transcriptional regulator